MWGQMVMKESRDFLTHCKFNAAQAAAISACDRADGVEDGVLEEPSRCSYDPKALLGTSAEGCGVFTAADINVIRKIWEGARREDGSFLWFGLPRGAAFAGMNNTTENPPAGNPFSVVTDYWKFLLSQNPQLDWTSVSMPQFEQLFDQGVEEYHAVLDTDDPDLSAFQRRGGKALLWHGLADRLIPPQGTTQYYDRVQRTMGGAAKTNSFLRLFLAPGVDHCSGGPGPAPSDALARISHRQVPLLKVASFSEGIGQRAAAECRQLSHGGSRTPQNAPSRAFSSLASRS
jgi:hypothetical protein